MERQYRFGFIFLDEIHHINHFVSIAVALSYDHQVSIITYPADHQYLKEKLKSLRGEKVNLRQLKTHPFRRFTDFLKKRLMPRKGFWMKYNHRHLLGEYDALVFTDYIHHKLLKYRTENSSPKFIKLPHGPVGRAYDYKAELNDFDLHIIFGNYHYQQLSNKDLLGKRTEIAGYFKNDALSTQVTPELFPDHKSVVVYNPHFDKEFTSWHSMGVDILEYFKNQDAFNLIFAPHINLFNKTGVESDESILKPYQNLPNIHIDLGSVASVDMVYTKMADIYLGDVSSQAIEFVIQPRPCIFINSHQVDYKGNNDYHFWQNGQVVDSIECLNTALQIAEDTFKTFESVQRDSTEKDFKTDENSTATERAVIYILELMRESNL